MPLFLHQAHVNSHLGEGHMQQGLPHIARIFSVAEQCSRTSDEPPRAHHHHHHQKPPPCVSHVLCQVWKDVDGVLTSDPRIVHNTIPVSQLTFEEATELAYFGAQVRTCNSVPLKLRSDFSDVQACMAL